jgi:predicted RNase H-like HicB family nuclease
VFQDSKGLGVSPFVDHFSCLDICAFSMARFQYSGHQISNGVEASPMSASRELSPDWVLSSFIHSNGNSRDEIMELADAARRLWPGVQAHARKEQPGKSFDEAIALATEVWEGVLPSNGDLGRLRQAHHSEVHRLLDQSLQVQEAVRRMDEWSRKVWAARQYGYSWREIADHFDLTEPQAKLRFRYAIGKLRALFGRSR